MNYRKLGRTGLDVSEISLGTWAMGTTIYGDVESGAPETLVQDAIDDGINLFDTAPLYGTKEIDGTAESVLGKALGAQKDNVLISSKFGRRATRVMPGHFNAAGVREDCEGSLRRLGRDVIDVYFFHSPFKPEDIDDDIWEALAELQASGKVRYIGHSVSMYADTAEMSASWMRERRIDVVQLVLSPFNREARPLIETAIACDVGVIARECLANGFLSGSITADTVFPKDSLNARYSREEIAERAAYAEELSNLLVGGDVKTLPQAAYRWTLDQAGVSTALSGAKRSSELVDVLRATKSQPYSPAILGKVESLHTKDFGAA